MPGLVVPCAVALILGLLCSGRWPGASSLPWLIAGAGGGVAVCAALTRLRALAAAGLCLAVFAGGWLAGVQAGARATERPIRRVLAHSLARAASGEVVFVEGRLREDAEVRDAGTWMVLELSRAKPDGHWVPVGGGVRLGIYSMVGPDAASAWRRGRCVRAPALLRVPTGFRDPGVADADLDLARRGIALVGSIKSASLVEACGDGTWLQERAGEARDVARAAIRRHVGTHSVLSAAITTAILIGDRGAIDDEVEERLRRAGTFHVIAISGGNIAILTGVLLWTMTALGARPRLGAVAAMIALGAYAAVVVRGASVDRAVLVALVYLAARVADIRAHPVALLASSASALLIWNPLLVFDVGFALTFGATAGLVLVTPPLLASWRQSMTPRMGTGTARAVENAFALLVATAAAETAVLPIAASAFGRVTFAGFVLNFAAIPLMSIVQIAGLAVAWLDAWVPLAAAVAGVAAHWGVQGLVESARIADAMPVLVRTVPPPSLGLLAVHVSALVVAVVPGAPRSARWTASCVVLGALVAMSAGWWPARSSAFAAVLPEPRALNAPLRVTLLDVGQGDAVVVRYPRGRVMVIDTGGLAASPAFDIGRRVVSPAMHALGVRRLDWLVLTHGDPDHIGGALAVIDDWRPREIWEGVPVSRHAPTERLWARAASLGIAWRRAQSADELTIDGVRLRVWHPSPPDWERQRVRNDDSIVIELRYGGVSVVLPGDIGALVEREIADRWAPAALTVLKAAHHGSAGSSDLAWLRALRPAAVVYSAGAGNRFGHPAPAAIGRAQSVGADLFRTDEDGAVQVATDGDRVEIGTMTGRVWKRRAW
jgi:competence protein ComEC